MGAFGCRLAGSVALLLLATTLDGQTPSPAWYYSQLPPTPPIVRQRETHARFHLYGDRRDASYRDVAPTDGIDDVRAARLRAIAERFSPIIRTNGAAPPRDFLDVLGARPTLHVDTFEGRRFLSSDAIPLWRESSAVGGDGDAGDGDADRRLRELIVSFHPDSARSRAVRAEGHLERVLYFDFEGHEPRTWRAAYANVDPARSRIHAHFLVQEHMLGDEPARYELAVQYWFFYPYNDGPNDHEGDWEHINVSVTTRSRAADTLLAPERWGLLDSVEVESILRGSGDHALDSLIIRSTEYYFHHHLLHIDYRQAYRSANPAIEDPPSIWVDEDFTLTNLRKRLALADGRLATHLLVYIGGRNRGPDELIALRPRLLGQGNHESHGNYPFPGNWVSIGQVDATERVYGPDVPRIRAGADTLPWHELIDDEFLVYTGDRIILLPDWERIAGLAMEDAEVRRTWGWMLLPVRFGYPASKSPGAGLIPHTDLGNLGAMSPTHNSAWNRLGETRDYSHYRPNVLRAAGAPVTPWVSMQSGFGALNVPLAAWGLLPGGNVASTQLLPWLTGTMHVFGRPPARTFYDGPLPIRITTFGQGAFIERGADEYARLLPHPGESDAVRALTGDPAGATTRYAAGASTGGRVWFNLFYGGVSLESTIGVIWSDVAYALDTPERDDPTTRVSGRLTRRELTGGVRLPLVSREDGTFFAFLRTGYGWIDYRVDDLRVDGAPISQGSREGGYLMSILPSRRWWPNSAYAGGGIELFAPRDWWIARRLGFGLRLEGTGMLHRLRSSTCEACGVNAFHGDFSISTVLGW